MNQNPFDDLTNRATQRRAGGAGSLWRLGRMWMAWFVGGVLGLLASLLVVAGPGATVLSSQGEPDPPSDTVSPTATDPDPACTEKLPTADTDGGLPDDVPFEPNISIAVPDQDDYGNRYMGATDICVTFRPTRSTGLYEGCSRGNAIVIYSVQSAGVATRTGIELVDIPSEHSGSRVRVRCSYQVYFPSGVEVESAQDLLRQSGNGRVIDSTSNNLKATFISSDEIIVGSRPEATFSPDVTISITGTDSVDLGNRHPEVSSFTVRFSPVSGSNENCTPSASETHVVGEGNQISRSGAQAVLVDTPEDIPGPVHCVYDVIWPTVDYFTLQPNATTGVRAQAKVASATYSYTSGSTSFSPVVEITVTDSKVLGNTNSDGDLVNDFTNTRFTVWFSSSMNGCSGRTAELHVVREDGTVERTSGQVNLVDFPQDSGISCVYDVTWPDDLPRLVKPSNAPGSVSESSGTLSVHYEASLLDFTPNITITVPDVDEDDNGINDLSSTTFVVRFTQSRTNAECSEPKHESHVVGDDGEVTRDGPGVTLVGVPEGSTTRCTYLIGWPTGEEVAGLLLDPRAFATPAVAIFAESGSASYVMPGTVDPADNPSTDATVEFVAPETTSPVITISVPDRDEDSNGANDFSGTTFDVGFTSDDEGCTPLAAETYEVDDDGNVALQSGSDRASLIKAPAGSGVEFGCEYSVVWPEVEGLQLGEYSDMLEIAASQFAGEEGNFNLVAAASYWLPDQVTLFTPNVSVVVPQVFRSGVNVFSGSRITVAFKRLDGIEWEDCTASAAATFTVNDDGSVTIDDEVELIDVHDVGEEDELSCFYKAEFDVRDHSNKILRVSPDVVNIDTDRNPIVGRYATALVPRLTIGIPQEDRNNDGANDFSGTRFQVFYLPVPGSSAGCSQQEGEVLQARDDGSVTLEPPPDGLDSLTVLIDVPPGESESVRCRYWILLPPRAGALSYQDPDPEDGPPDPGAIENTIRAGVVGSRLDLANCVASIIGCYSPPPSFTPTIAIRVPQTQDRQAGVNDWAGTTFTATFRPIANSNVGCTQVAIATVEIGNDGRSTTTSPARLNEHPQFEDGDCRYDVIWSTIPGLAVQPSSTQQTDKNEDDITGVYWVASDSTFNPQVRIDVPQTDERQSGVNDWSGTQLVVTFNRIAGADGRCTETATATVEIGDDGRSATTQEADLVNRPAGSDARCVYTVIWPAISGLAVQSGSTAQTDDTSRSVTGIYQAAGG